REHHRTEPPCRALPGETCRPRGARRPWAPAACPARPTIQPSGCRPAPGPAGPARPRVTWATPAPTPQAVPGRISHRCARPRVLPPGRGPVPAGGGRRPRRPRLGLVLAILAGLVVVLLILVIGGYFYLDGKLNRSNVLVSYAGQPAAGAGSNWLITGSDSRQGLTRKQERQYHTRPALNR